MTDFSKDLDKIEYVTMRRGYSCALADLYIMMADMMTQENAESFMELKRRMEHMESLRQETNFTIPKDL
jgi:hypothetical protein